MNERVRAAVDALGGIEKFIKPGEVVVIKPNAAFAQTPPMGGNTTPEVVESVIQLCKEARAKSVTVVEHCLSAHDRFGTTHDLSGITRVALKEDVPVFDTGSDPANYRKAFLNAPEIPYHGFMEKILDADVVINVPRAKTHPWAGYTLCVKNLMGTMQHPRVFHTLPEKGFFEEHWRNLLKRLGMEAHRNPYKKLAANLVALDRFMQKRVNLNIVDMTHLVRGWSATIPGKLEDKNTIVAGTNMVSVDAFCIKVFGDDPLGSWQSSLSDNYIRLMHEAGLGNADVESLSVNRMLL